MGWTLAPGSVRPETELCAFVCTPTVHKGKPVFVNCQLFADSELLRLAVDLEDHDFQCKVSYDLTNKRNVDEWWEGKRADVAEWMADMGVADLTDAVTECMRKMLVPLKAKLKGSALPPSEKKVFVISDAPPEPEPPVQDKPKRAKRQEDEGPQLF